MLYILLVASPSKQLPTHRQIPLLPELLGVSVLSVWPNQTPFLLQIHWKHIPNIANHYNAQLLFVNCSNDLLSERRVECQLIVIETHSLTSLPLQIILELFKVHIVVLSLDGDALVLLVDAEALWEPLHHPHELGF